MKINSNLFCSSLGLHYLCSMNAEKGSILTASMMAEKLKVRPANAHKGIMGHALLVVGSPGMAGCAVLAAEACLRSGVGKLSVHIHEENRLILQTSVPEACLFIGDKTSQEALPQTHEFQSVGIGPGIGRSARTQSLLDAYLTQQDIEAKPILLDADALHLLAEAPQTCFHLRNHCIMTPHLGEMKALAHGFTLQTENLLQAALDLAQQEGLIIILKGHPTHICLPEGELFICPRGNAGMATAGSGDVLTGLITGLLAQGYLIADAALLGVWLHATAGDLAAQELGQECMLARDITRHLPEAFHELHQLKEQ